MTNPDLDIGRDRLTPTERKRTEARTAVPDQKRDITDTPAYWTLPAVVAWQLSRDPSEVVALCGSFPTGDEIVQGAERMRRLQLLWLLASRAIGIDAGEERHKAIAADVRELHGALVARKLTRDRWHHYHSLRRLLMRERSEIAKTVDDAIRELFGMLRAEKLTAVDDDLKPVPSPKFKRIPERHRFVESRVGQRDVGIARAEVLRCWPEPTTPTQCGHWRSEEGRQSQRYGTCKGSSGQSAQGG